MGNHMFSLLESSLMAVLDVAWLTCLIFSWKLLGMLSG